MGRRGTHGFRDFAALHAERVRRSRPAARWRQVRKPFAARAGERTSASLGLATTHEVMLAHKGRLRFGFTSDGLFMVVLSFRLPDA